MAQDVNYPVFPYTEFQKKWLSTLEGKEEWKPKQTIAGGLKSTDNQFCCLGVACELFAETDTDMAFHNEPVANGTFYAFGYGNEKDNYELLPEEVRAELGLWTSCGEPINGPYDMELVAMDALTELNDNGTPFATLAHLIKTFPHFYFNNNGEPIEETYGSTNDIEICYIDIVDYNETGP